MRKEHKIFSFFPAGAKEYGKKMPKIFVSMKPMD